MSAGYASRLKEYPQKGVCGLPEHPDTCRLLTAKTKRLVEMIQNASNIVIFTGAGISTSSGIPDFRGPAGIWTQEEKKRKQERKEQHALKRQKSTHRGRDNVNHDRNIDHQVNTTSTEVSETSNNSRPVLDFASAKPSLTHRAITYLAMRIGIVKHVITQNVDGLHQRSGLSRDYLSVLHGCAFTEKCSLCHTEHFRDYDIGGIGFQKTGRRCDVCGGDLQDTLLDWDDRLPELDFKRAKDACEKADLAICLGTSLRIEPACDLPLFAKKCVIINLQATGKDSEASLIIRHKVDAVMVNVMEQLGLTGWDNNEANERPVGRLWKHAKLG